MKLTFKTYKHLPRNVVFSAKYLSTFYKFAL